MNGHKSINLFIWKMILANPIKVTAGSGNDSRKNDVVSWLKVQNTGPSQNTGLMDLDSKSRVDPGYHMQEVLKHVVHISYFEKSCSRVIWYKASDGHFPQRAVWTTWMSFGLGPYVPFRLHCEIGRLNYHCRAFSFVAPKIACSGL